MLQLLLVVEVVRDQLRERMGELRDELATCDLDEEDRHDDVVNLVPGVHRHDLGRDGEGALLQQAVLQKIEEEHSIQLMLHHPQLLLPGMVRKPVSLRLHDVLHCLSQIFELYDQVKQLLIVDKQELVAVELGEHLSDLIDSGIVSLEEGKPHLVFATAEHARIDLGKHEEVMLDIVLVEDVDNRIDVIFI